MALVDAAGRPAGENAAVQEALGGDDDVALEVGRFCIESATAPVPLAGRPFTALSERLTESVGRIAAAAAVHGARVAMIGTLPTLTMGDLGPGGLTESPRYRALSAALEPMKPDRRVIIDGPETLDVELPGIVAEAANAAFQIHLRVPPADFARTFNAAQLATAPGAGGVGQLADLPRQGALGRDPRPALPPGHRRPPGRRGGLAPVAGRLRPRLGAPRRPRAAAGDRRPARGACCR